MDLRANVVARAALCSDEVERMFSLYAASYRDTARARFLDDLGDKTHCIVLRDGDGTIQGFSTLKLYETRWRETRIRVMFSGDTIIDPAHWGTQQLAFAWIRHAGDVRRAAPAVPLYWFLICKGHRTYRYLGAFARHYLPLAGARADGRDVPQGRLAPELASVPDAHRRIGDVAYFLQRNPGYARGDELVCLCELSAPNLRPLARRLFEGA
jgi:hypothetical protein